MKVGDLVQPSARILSQKGFYWLSEDSYGLVVRKPHTQWGTWQILWYAGKTAGKSKALVKDRIWNMRREWVKIARVKK